jgi:hypothetical protein
MSPQLIPGGPPRPRSSIIPFPLLAVGLDEGFFQKGALLSMRMPALVIAAESNETAGFQSLLQSPAKTVGPVLIHGLHHEEHGAYFEHGSAEKGRDATAFADFPIELGRRRD